MDIILWYHQTWLRHPRTKWSFFLLAAEMAIAIIAMDYQSYLLCSTRLGYFAYNIYIYHIIIPPSIPIYFDMTISQYG